ncbi:MAG: NlpC/P60 family protein [Bradyrhizobium sp.]|uniref:NlpC/P60 family protein n=1 Tax=Bradyrhizobium sp. TaxID=376 RepID=UPI003D0BF5A9
MNNHWSASYVGLPWRDRGREPSGVDCWGLVRLALQECAGIETPSYDEGYTSVAELREVAGLFSNTRRRPWLWVELGQEREFDMILLGRRSVDYHCGIVVERGLMLHVEEGSRARIEPYSAFRNISGIYRHEALL